MNFSLLSTMPWNEAKSRTLWKTSNGQVALDTRMAVFTISPILKNEKNERSNVSDRKSWSKHLPWRNLAKWLPLVIFTTQNRESILSGPLTAP